MDSFEPVRGWTTYQPSTFAMTGATGSLGLHFLEAMLTTRPDSRAIALVRSDSPSYRRARFQHLLNQFEDRITLIEGDLAELNLSPRDARLLTRTDGGLWHFAGAVSLKPHEPAVAELAQRINDAATRQLLRGVRQEGHGPFWHVSTAFVAGDRTGRVLEDELDCGQSFRNAFEASKARAEQAVRTQLEAGMEGAVFRPGIVLENPPARRIANLAELCARAILAAGRRGEPFVLRMDPAACINLVHAEWVIAAMIDLARIAPEPHRPGVAPTYHLVAPQPSPLNHLAHILEQHLPRAAVRFDPLAPSVDLPEASRRFDRVFADLRPYVQSSVTFDRTRTDRDLSPGLRHNHFDFAAVVARLCRTHAARTS